MSENEGAPSKLASRRAHMANERTFLAWVRTAIGIMAFGFVVEKFAFFVRHFQDYIGSKQYIPSLGFSQLAGISLVAFGMLITALAFIRYRTIEKELDQGTYKPNMFLTTALTFFVIGLFHCITSSQDDLFP